MVSGGFSLPIYRGSGGAFDLIAMGCDFSHCGLRMSYGGFRSLVDRLAEEAGIALREMEGYGGSVPWKDVNDPLVPLLNAFDEYGGGEVAGSACPELSRRLWEIAECWSDSRHKNHGWHEQCAQLAHAVGEAGFLGEAFYWF